MSWGDHVNGDECPHRAGYLCVGKGPELAHHGGHVQVLVPPHHDLARVEHDPYHLQVVGCQKTGTPRFRRYNAADGVGKHTPSDDYTGRA